MRYQLFGRSGLRVSELALGTMTFGTEWGHGADRETSRAIFDRFAEAGGTFIDTANRYTEGTSETYVGECIATDRDHFVVATKYSLQTRLGDLNAAGNHKKNMLRSVEASLRRLNTDYIDVYWLHAWDFTTPEEEVMRSLDDLVRSGKVLHVGVSDTPAWVVAKSNTLADLRGWSQFVGLQIEYSLVRRDAERELLPMAAAFGLHVTPWSPLGAGVLSGKYLASSNLEGVRLKPESLRLSASNIAIATEVAAVAAEIGCTSPQVALAWIRQQQPGAIPILGVRSVAQLDDNLQCLDTVLSSAQMERLNTVSAIVLGFPHDMLAAENIKDMLFSSMSNVLDR
ncbi:aldo/keto reductase [soil metagenome]